MPGYPSCYLATGQDNEWCNVFSSEAQYAILPCKSLYLSPGISNPVSYDSIL